MAKPKILFMGTAEFAVPALSLLVEQGYPIAAVVTQPDKPRGRGRKFQPSPVKLFALNHHLPILQPEQVRDYTFLTTFRQLGPDFVILAAYGQLLPQEIIDQPQMPCLNIHPSLLPKYRGAAPINWAIIRGEEATGVTIMQMVEELDAGAIILQEETPIGPEETFDQLHDRLALRGAKLILQSIEMIMNGTAARLPQDETAATYAPRLKKEDGRIQWDQACHLIINLIRGLSSLPGAYTILDGKKLKIFRAQTEIAKIAEAPGTIVQRKDKGMAVAVRDGYIHLLDVQMENKKRMLIEDFLRGYQLQPVSILG